MLYLGNRHAWGDDEPFGIEVKDRRQHVHIVGKTGTGKTTLLRNMILQDILAGRGVGLIDPHGDLAHELLDHIPLSRADDVVYFNPADVQYPVGINLLQNVPPDNRHLVASGVVGAFKNIWRDSWGPRTEYILYATVAALLECPNTSILGIQRMLVDSRYRTWVIKQVKDAAVRSFWLDEFAEYDNRFMREAIAPIQNKVGQVLFAPHVRHIYGQVRSRIDPRFIMDDRRILIASLSKGTLGEDKANLLGSLLVTQFQLAAMARADMPEAQREDFYLYIDEFHNFTTDAFASILSEARKYRLCLTLGHQYFAQLPLTIRDAVLGNVGTHVAFRVGYQDALTLSQEYGGELLPVHFTDLANHQICTKLLVNGEQIQPFTAKTYSPLDHYVGGRDQLIRRSREKYATRRDVIEDKLRRWMGRDRDRA